MKINDLHSGYIKGISCLKMIDKYFLLLSLTNIFLKNQGQRNEKERRESDRRSVVNEDEEINEREIMERISPRRVFYLEMI